MNVYSSLRHLALLCFAVGALALNPQRSIAADEEYSFKVHNKTEQAIKQVLVSVDKKTWGKFDIGKGIPAGKTVKLVWDKSTNKEECKQWVKAVYADEEESKPARFDFCEDDLEIEFEE